MTDERMTDEEVREIGGNYADLRQACEKKLAANERVLLNTEDWKETCDDVAMLIREIDRARKAEAALKAENEKLRETLSDANSLLRVATPEDVTQAGLLLEQLFCDLRELETETPCSSNDMVLSAARRLIFVIDSEPDGPILKADGQPPWREILRLAESLDEREAVTRTNVTPPKG